MTRTAALIAWTMLTLFYTGCMILVAFFGAPHLAIFGALIAGPASLVTFGALLLVDRSHREAR